MLTIPQAADPLAKEILFLNKYPVSDIYLSRIFHENLPSLQVTFKCQQKVVHREEALDI